ncbi:MAG: magnesium-protoporphyrin IX monomethyl ester cyclase, partial [Cyanobacteriota bacterium]|nr:magnesium-protoporphyrin IX monomethyl ester cyclase [Cyanobacteriota bacterium]
STAPAPLRVLRKLPHWLGNGLEMVRLFLMPAIASERAQPAVR